ncbi:hypothetical protein FRC17_006155 [Serendipita sp. 399]|nr:hypothetical protein FRC17_006155 [Serendipita sp. 399]
MPVSLNEDALLEIFKWFVSTDEDGPFTIFFLSNKWREILLRTPTLWMWIMIDSGHDDWMERVHTCLELSQGLPIYLTLKWPFPDLSRFAASLKKVNLLVAEIKDETDIHTFVIPLFKPALFPNVHTVLYLRRTDGREEFTDISLTSIRWDVVDVHDMYPPETVTGFRVNLQTGGVQPSRIDWNIAINMMETFRSLRCLVLHEYAVKSSTVLFFEDTKRLEFPILKELEYQGAGALYSRSSFSICAPALSKMTVGDYFYSTISIFHSLRLEMHPIEFAITPIFTSAIRDDYPLRIDPIYYDRVSTLDLNLRHVLTQALDPVKKGVHALVAQMPRLFNIRIRVSSSSFEILSHILPFPRAKNKSPLVYHIEIVGKKPQYLLHRPPCDILVDCLKLDVPIWSWQQLPKTRQLILGRVVNIQDLILAISSFHPRLEYLETDSFTGRLIRLHQLYTMPSLLNLTTLRTCVNIALAFMQLRVVPALKTLSLIPGDGAQTQKYGRRGVQSVGRLSRDYARGSSVSHLPQLVWSL